MVAHPGWRENHPPVRLVLARYPAQPASVHHPPHMDRTVLIVDDHAEFRTSARALLVAEGWTVIGEAASGAEGVRLVAQLRPAVVLLDIALPDQDGFRVADALALELDPPHVVLVSSRDARAYGRRIVQAPVRGFLPKQRLSGEALADLLP